MSSSDLEDILVEEISKCTKEMEVAIPSEIILVQELSIVHCLMHNSTNEFVNSFLNDLAIISVKFIYDYG